MSRSTRVAARFSALLAALATAGCLSPPQEDGATATAAERGLTPAPEGALYHLGYVLGEKVAMEELDEQELDEVVQGLRDRARGREPRYGRTEEHWAAIGDFLSLRRREIGEQRLETERTHLEAAAAAPGAHTTEGGAVVRVLEAGQGAAPDSGQVLRVHYDGALVDGTPLPSTRSQAPYELVPDRTNPCWREALLGWGAVGASLRVTCPPELLFGMQGKSGWTPPGAVSVWTLDLIAVVEP